MVDGCCTKQYGYMDDLVLDHIVVMKKNMRASHFTMIWGGGMRGCMPNFMSMPCEFHVETTTSCSNMGPNSLDNAKTCAYGQPSKGRFSPTWSHM